VDQDASTERGRKRVIATNKRMGELAIIVVNRFPYYFLDLDVPFFADFAAFFFAAIFNYIKNRSYLNFLKECR
jgi:hypothetical protein